MAKKVSVSKKYIDFSDVFSKKTAAIFPYCSDINKHAINLKPSKQPPYKPIYSLSLVRLKTFKTYIKANLVNKFIWSSKSFVRASIFLSKNSTKAFVCI